MFSKLCILFTFIAGMLKILGITNVSWGIILAPTLLVTVGGFILCIICLLLGFLSLK
jgi:hypothetical protein|nr:MAG TPA: hypothetical protein [Caudoviricetes sp.]